jgi:hypothetical protein
LRALVQLRREGLISVERPSGVVRLTATALEDLGRKPAAAVADNRLPCEPS